MFYNIFLILNFYIFVYFVLFISIITNINFNKMKKTILTMAMILFMLNILSASETKLNVKSYETIDSISPIIKRNKDNTIQLNIDGIEYKKYITSTILKYSTENCTKYETILFDEMGEQVALNILLYSDGTKYITLKDLSFNGVMKFKIK